MILFRAAELLSNVVFEELDLSGGFGYVCSWGARFGFVDAVDEFCSSHQFREMVMAAEASPVL